MKMERGLKALRLKVGSHNIEEKLSRRSQEAEELGNIINNIHYDNQAILAKIENEKIDC